MRASVWHVGLLVLSAFASPTARATETGPPSRIEAARAILRSSRITLQTRHLSGVRDLATARQNVEDTARGRRARRSAYDNAPGGTVLLSDRMLRGLLALAEDYTFRVTEIAGGSHSERSAHYGGSAVDIDVIDARVVSATHPGHRAFMARARALGAVEILGPGHGGHANHIHLAWRRR
ncbi:MAG: carboxypeptidase [Deltaproteobacteria bacterium]|nr:carboxypeptidase [Deltaproteobacteria bacterium]